MPEEREAMSYVNPEAMLLDGYDDCIVGWVERFGMTPVALYDKSKIIDRLMKDGCTNEEAVEHFDFNILGAWVGDGTPAFMTRFKP